MSAPEPTTEYRVGGGPYFYRVGAVLLSTDKIPGEEALTVLRDKYGITVEE